MKTGFSEEVCGSDLNYDSDFEAIKKEVSKSEGIDYSLVEEKAYNILSQKSKDIRVFSYLALCYLKKEDWCLFCDLFEALMHLSREMFDALFPRRLTGKWMAFKWLDASRFTEILENATVSSVAHEQMNRLVSVLDNLRDSLSINFPDSSPFPEKLYAFAKKWRKLTEQKRPELSQPINNPDIPEDHVSKERKTTSSFSDDFVKNEKTAFDSIRKCALFLIEKEPQKSAGYRLMRVARWENIEMLPFTQAMLTKIEPPSQERRAFLISLVDKGDFKSALCNSEMMFSSGNTLFWLDLQRISAKAAENLGVTFAGVNEAIILETALFVNKFPQMINLKFIDGTPFSNTETKKWIEQEVSETLRKNDFSYGNKTEKEDLRLSETSNNTEEEGLQFLVDGIKKEVNELDNFKRRLSVVSCMLDARRPEIALFMLESLYELADTYSLARWVPSLVVDLLDLMIRTYEVIAKEKSGDKKSLLIEKRDSMLKKMCYLDPGIALNFQPFDER